MQERTSAHHAHGLCTIAMIFQSIVMLCTIIPFYGGCVSSLNANASSRKNNLRKGVISTTSVLDDVIIITKHLADSEIWCADEQVHNLLEV